MSDSTARIPDEELAEHWYAFMHRLMGTLQKTFLEEQATTGLTQKDIAERLGKSPASISRWLSGQQNMTARTLHDLARGMGCRLDMAVQPLRTLRPANRPAYLDAKPDVRIGVTPATGTALQRTRRYEATLSN